MKNSITNGSESQKKWAISILENSIKKIQKELNNAVSRVEDKSMPESWLIIVHKNYEIIFNKLMKIQKAETLIKYKDVDFGHELHKKSVQDYELKLS